MSERNDIIKLWKEKNIAYAKFEYNCGGDSMGDSQLFFYDKDGNEITSGVAEIDSYLNDEVYREVDFYVNSDGHYIGEAGYVHIELDEDDEEGGFTYSKNSQYEYNESHESDMEFHLTPEEKAFIEAHVLNINGGEDNAIAVNYKHDFLMTDEEEELVEELKQNIDKACEEYTPKDDYEGDLQDWYRYTTNEQGTDIEFKDDMLIIHMSNSTTVYKDN